MFHNKTLGAAIAMALSLGVNSTEAASFSVCVANPGSYSPSTFNATSHCFKSSASLTYAYEQFSSTTATLDFPFRARYTVSSTLGTNYDFYITFTLSNGATWKSALSSANLTLTDPTAGTTVSGPTIALVGAGSTTDSEVSYKISSQLQSGISTAQVLDFNFLVSNAQYALKSPGGQITLTATLRKADSPVPTAGTAIDTALTTVLATSTEGIDVQIASPSETNPAYISVLGDGKVFEGSGIISTTQVQYGYINIKSKSALTALSKGETVAPSTVLGGASPTTSPSSWTPSFAEGKLTIDNGNFNASGAASSGKVYIDKGDSAYTSLKNATSFSDDRTTATWTLAAADVQSIYSGGIASVDRRIILNVDGQTTIIENRKSPPKATLYVKYGEGAGITRTAVLRHLKKNGSVCTLYNIPPSDEKQDVLNIRITNDSSIPGFVKGTLRDMDGKEIYKGQFFVEQGKLASHQTVRLIMADISAKNTFAWQKRAVLTLESNVPNGSLQVYGLLRNTGSKSGLAESPLMNMSTGATGNGCD